MDDEKDRILEIKENLYSREYYQKDNFKTRYSKKNSKKIINDSWEVKKNKFSK